MPTNFTHLHTHTSIGSMADSMANVNDLFKKAADLKMSALAITDHGTMAAVFDACKASKKHGVKFIPGLEAYFVDTVTEPKASRKHIVLLSKNEVGFRNLLTLNYKGFENNQYIPIMGKVFPRIDWEMLEEHHEGLICTSACAAGPLAAEMFRLDETGEWDEESCYVGALKVASRFKEIFGDDFYLELQPHAFKKMKSSRKTHELEKTPSGELITLVDQNYMNKKMLLISKELDIPVTVGCDVHYLAKEDAEAHDMLMAINDKKPLSDPHRHRYGIEEFYMKTGEEVLAYFTKMFNKEVALKLCRNTVKISDQCEDSSYIKTDEIRFPNFDATSEGDYKDFLKWQKKQNFDSDLAEDKAYMRYRCITAFKEKYSYLKGTERKKYRDRIINEIKVLEDKNFSSYMLITSDLMCKAKENKIRTSPGRGCLFSDALVVTNIGNKKLVDVNIGDYVYTHTGQLKEVLDTFEYNIDEPCVKVKTEWSHEDIIMTSDHEVYAEKSQFTSKYLKRKEAGLRPDRSKKYANLCNRPSWTPISHLSVGDHIFMPFAGRAIEKINTIDLAQFSDYSVCANTLCKSVPITNGLSIREISKATGLDRNTIRRLKSCSLKTKPATKKRLLNYLSDFGVNIEEWANDNNCEIKEINRFIEFDENFSYFVGRWIGDGWYKLSSQSNYIAIAFHSDDFLGMNKIIDYLNSLGFECRFNHSKTKKLSQMYVYGKTLANFFKQMVSDYRNTSSTKHLPSFFRTMSDNLLRSMLDGLIDSDGHIEGNRINIDTTSERLALEVKEALLYLKIRSSISPREPYFRGEYLCSKSFKVRYNLSNKAGVFENGYFCKITSLETVNDVKKVYDIKVEDDHSYLTSNFAVHNSVGGSLVAQLLGIHEVNPIQYGLLFERFHNKEKTSYPDIDSDFSPNGRDWMEQYVVNKYGQNKVAHVSNLSTMTPKVVIKDVARSLELGGGKSEAFKIANAITDSIAPEAKTFEGALKSSEQFREFCKKYPDVEKYGRKLVGLEKTFATHAAGIVISDIDLTTYVPLRFDKNGAVSVQYEKNRCEDVGLIKMDLLGLEHLKIIDNTIINAKLLGQECPETDKLEPFDDKDVWDMVSKGKTTCVFQMGSHHMKALCKRIKPKCIEDLSLVNALGRPSAGQSKGGNLAPRDVYINRRDGKEKVTIKYKCLKEPLKETLGICVYEEQLLKIAKYAAGWDLNKADVLRKFTKLKGKDPNLAAQIQEDFVNDTSKFSHLTKVEAHDIWENFVEPFSGYGFNKAHGIFYSLNGYHTAYYKHHFPTAFMAAVLKSEIEKTSSSEEKVKIYKKEAVRMGIKINAPDINKSEECFSVLDDKTIVMGLTAVKGVGAKAVQNIIETRAEHKFVSFSDFLYRTKSGLVRKNVIQALAKAGCFDGFSVTRKSIFDKFADLRSKANKFMSKAMEKFPEMKQWDIITQAEWVEKEAEILGTDEWTKKEILIGEGETLGEYISGTINDLYSGFFTNKGVTPIKNVKKLAEGTPIRVEVVIESVMLQKHKGGRNKGAEYGSCVITDVNQNSITMKAWSNKWSRVKGKIIAGKPIRAVCRVNVFNDSRTLILDTLEQVG